MKIQPNAALSASGGQEEKPPGGDWHFLCDPLKFRWSLLGSQIKEEEIDQNICEAEGIHHL